MQLKASAEDLPIWISVFKTSSVACRDMLLEEKKIS